MKNCEKPMLEQTLRVRAVVHGEKEKDLVDGRPAMFDPSGKIQAARPREVRTATVTGRQRGSRGRKADVSGACVNTKFAKPTYARLPKWRRVRLFGHEDHFKRPLNRLPKMLYGKKEAFVGATSWQNLSGAKVGSATLQRRRRCGHAA